VNPSNQPDPKPGEVKIGVFVEGDEESSIGTFYDGVTKHKIKDGTKKIAKWIARELENKMKKF